MPISQEQEEHIIHAVLARPDEHFVLPAKHQQGGPILVSRDGLRVYLHRRLYRQIIGPLSREEFLLPACEMGYTCFNPRHYTVSSTPSTPRPQCRNGHNYTEIDRNADGTRTCHVCAEERAARRPRKGGEPHWMEEKRRRFCPWGHEYTLDNTYVYQTPSGGTRRKCKTCTMLRASGADPADVGVA